MLMMVIKKPALVTIVSAVPFCSVDAFCATSVENIGESAITIHPQKTRKEIKTIKENEKLNADKRQQIHEHNKAMKAVLLAPIFSDIYPLAIQANDPIAITQNESKDKFSSR